MATNKEKQNLRYRQVSERINKKVRYDGLNKDQVALIKAQKEYEQVEKELNKFWASAPRLENNSVDWENISDQELDYFEHISKKSEKLYNKISKLEYKGVDLDHTMNVFMMLNLNSVSF